MGSDDIKHIILDLVVEYYKLKRDESIPDVKIHYSGRVYDYNELVSLVSASLDFWLTHGDYCYEFENKFSEFVGTKHSLFVNSGSSANLLAIMGLKLNKGDEVITTATCFPTTVSPIVNSGAIPVFVDTDIHTLNIDLTKLESAVSNKTKAVMVAHTLGNPIDMDILKGFCDNHKLWLISDECDALGAKYNGNNLTYYSDISTFSFYPAHHITTGEGGMVCTNNAELYNTMLSMRDWGRDCRCRSGQDNLCGKRFSGTYGKLPYGYDHKYVYSNFGYNLKATEMQGAVGLVQLNKLDGFIIKRNNNWTKYYNGLSNLKDYFIFQDFIENSFPSRFGFAITLRDGVDFSRNDLVKFLEDNYIQTRMLFSGNLLLHPCFDNFSDYKISGELYGSNKIAIDTLFVGVYPSLCDDDINYVISRIREFVRR